MTQNVPDRLISQLSKFVSSQMGLYFPKERWADLKRGITSAALDLDFDNPVSYIHWLLSPPLIKKKVDTLAKHLTIGETFFFRDENIFYALKNNIIPELVKKHGKKDKSIRLWSAGCSTGEEPYSIAIFIDQTMVLLEDWDITILATDINTGFLQKAVKGVYTSWSFRNTRKWVIEKYFKKIAPNRFEIAPYIKKKVGFSQLNLTSKAYWAPLSNTAMDVIFCRNILMYFDPKVINEVVERLTLCLVQGGWLIVNPIEAAFVQNSDLYKIQLPGTILFKKKYADRHKESPKDTRTRKEIAEPEQNIYQEACALYKQGRYKESVKKLTGLFHNGQAGDNVSVLEPGPMALIAKAYANQGKLVEAKRWCKKALDAEKLHPGHHYLLATIYQEEGRVEESIKFFKKAIYLDPKFVLAHFMLGNLAHQEGKKNESIKHFNNVLSLLLSIDTEEILPHSGGLTAGKLAEVVQTMIKGG